MRYYISGFHVFTEQCGFPQTLWFGAVCHDTSAGGESHFGHVLLIKIWFVGNSDISLREPPSIASLPSELQFF